MVDQAKIYIKAGDGGHGSIHFRREKYVPKGGPDGGDGGRGGSVYIETDTDLATLRQFAHKQKFEAQAGEKGGGQRRSGKSGRDLLIRVPLGTQVKFLNEAKMVIKKLDFDHPGVRILVAKGGRGGRGNWHFKSSVNTTPREAEAAEAGEAYWLELELKLLADVGVVGLPSVGKSSLLSILTAAQPKVAEYEFTTLEPNLGVMGGPGGDKKRELVLADIPGLIEGASQGRGLGDKFLRHIERTQVLVHLVALRESQLEYLADEVGDKLAKVLWDNYEAIRKELAEFGAGLEDKVEIVALNKIDLMSRKQVERVRRFFGDKKIELETISCGTLARVENLKLKIWTVFE